MNSQLAVEPSLEAQSSEVLLPREGAVVWRRLNSFCPREGPRPTDDAVCKNEPSSCSNLSSLLPLYAVFTQCGPRGHYLIHALPNLCSLQKLPSYAQSPCWHLSFALELYGLFFVYICDFLRHWHSSIQVLARPDPT